VWVSGRVHGVGYRASCSYRAGQLGVAGWARNLDDGRVEVVLEGEPEAVDALVEWCGRGPRQARVTRVDVVEEAPDGAVGFSIR
jgi:acylphosphatase